MDLLFLDPYDSKSEQITTSSGEIISISDPKAFKLLSNIWLRSGWDTKYVYCFSWMGRPIIQLPEDILRIQELIYQLKPDVIIETGVAHGGSLVFYASLCNAIGKGRIIGVDIEIREHNRKAIQEHDLYKFITLIEGSSTDKIIFEKVESLINHSESVLVILDSNHTKSHVFEELKAYSKLIKKDGYIVACDGIMKNVKGAPRTEEDWDWNNPLSAIDEFISENKNFKVIEPNWPFNESLLNERVTYWPNAFIKKIK